jgi:plasmid stabilization system protein ParE
MKNGYKILWSKRAFEDLDGILNYLEENWTKKEVRKFVSKLHKRLILLSFFPKLYSESHQKKNVRKSVLTKQVVIYYSLNNNVVELIRLFDSRQQPSKLKL